MDIEAFIKKVEKLGIEVAQTPTTLVVPCAFSEHSDVPKGKTANLMIGKRTRIGKGVMCSHEGNLEEIFGAIQNKASQHASEPVSDEKAQQPRIIKIESVEREMTFSEWRETIKSNFPDLVFASEVAASIVAQILIIDLTNPFALVLVDVPSSGKTITINFFSEIEGLTYATDKFTPASFVSNASNVKKEKLKDIDLLPRLRYKMFLLRDLATLFSKRDDDLNESLGILTRVLDGEGFNADTGVHGDRHYTGDYLFMILAGSTPIPHRVWKMMGNLGSRLFFLNMASREKSEDELSEQNTTTSYKDKEAQCRQATQDFLKTLWHDNPEGIAWDKANDSKEEKLIIARCAKLLARLRGVVNVWEEKGIETKYDYKSTVIEKPDRINQLFYNLARGHAVIQGRRRINRSDLKPVIELAVDSCLPARARLFRKLLDNNGAMKTSEVEVALLCSKPTALKEMETLRILGVATVSQESFGEVGEPEKEIKLAKDLVWFLSDECRELRGIPPRTEGVPSVLP
jgi:hypothetical protein